MKIYAQGVLKLRHKSTHTLGGSITGVLSLGCMLSTGVTLAGASFVTVKTKIRDH